MVLQRYGFAEPAPARSDGRDRPWQATDSRTQFDLDTSTPAGAAATAAVGLAYIDSSRAVAEAFVATEREEPEEWRDVAALANADLWLTAEETERSRPAWPPSSSPTGTEPSPTAPTALVACAS